MYNIEYFSAAVLALLIFKTLLIKAMELNSSEICHYHKEAWGSGGNAPLILKVCTRWRRVVSFTLCPL
jgi:hypothetical protein